MADKNDPTISTKPIEIATLRDGSEEAMPLVIVTTLHLKKLWEEDPIAAFEAVAIARDPHHSPFGNTGGKLKALGLTDSEEGGMHSSIRAIIQNSVEGEALDLRLRSPIQPQELSDADAP